MLGTYTARFNRRHKVFGHLFSGRYKALIVGGSGTGYLKTVCDYVHLNPARARLLTPAQALTARRQAEAGADYELIRRGWCLGKETFRKELLAQMTERIGAEHYGAERLETAEAKAERILGEELKRWRWQEAGLAKRAKGDLGKVQIAGRLRVETLVTVK